ncbi:uncharacterized protein CCOS01_06461 [Colletotrichum costaricense]|uniref:NmrA-like domain-containing protein n=1 Tax=Colletotrichum costaricense TaxID=1209916 RepID=A0AAJ0E1U9_9PEZI|nr:uncharacterized protein CCOS01_06461 [Colletotrichum costaricense]KAK1528627.1 hypothetical protein CCOS01_06461 [Colletotrichum costaricense]
MQTIAVAGGGGMLGRAIVDALLEDGTFNVLILTRTLDTKEQGGLGAPVIAIDYDDVDAISNLLEAKDVEVVVSAIVTLHGSGPEMNLIRAAEKSSRTRRFVPSFWAHDYPEEFRGYFFAKPKYDALELLDATSLEYTAFRIGWFIDYYVAPYVKSYIKPEGLFIDMENNAAAVPGSGDSLAIFTHSLDVAQFVTAYLHLPKWEKSAYIRGDRLSWNQFLQLAEEIKDLKFNVVHDSERALKDGIVTELPAHQQMYEHVPKESLITILGIYGQDFAMGGFDFDPPQLVNDLFPSIKAKTVRELLQEAWGKKSDC